MPQTISFVTEDNRKSRRKQSRGVAEEVKGLGFAGAVAIYTPGIPQNSLAVFTERLFLA